MIRNPPNPCESRVPGVLARQAVPEDAARIVKPETYRIPSMRSRNYKIGIIVSILGVMPSTWVFPDTGNDLPVGGQEEGKFRNLQEISAAECCARNSGKDIRVSVLNDDPEGIWSDGVTMWVADESDEKLYAYVLASGERVRNKEFRTLDDAGNDEPEGIWSDGTTMWVADDPWVGEKVFAYEMATMARDADKDINALEFAGNDNPEGIWSDGTTMWVADYSDRRLYAYYLTSGARVRNKDFNTLNAAGNDHPTGIWSDGTTIWVADDLDDKIYAYDMTSKARDADKDFNTLDAAGNDDPTSIWSDGTTMWVADDSDEKLYAYDMTFRGGATLGAPGILSVTAGTGSLTVSWAAPSSSGGSAITAYDLRYISSDASDKADANWTVVLEVWTTGSGALSYEVTGLTSGASYDVQLRAVTSAGYGAWSPVRIGTPLVQGPASTDFNGDGRTDFVDFFLFADAYGGTDARFDLDGNGRVDFADFFRFVDAFGT